MIFDVDARASDDDDDDDEMIKRRQRYLNHRSHNVLEAESINDCT